MAFNDRGEFVDPWNTPLRIDIEHIGKPIIDSAGKNKEFEGDEPTDDIRIIGGYEDRRVGVIVYFPNDIPR